MYSHTTLSRKVRDLALWKKICIVIFFMAFIRVGSNIPLPFVNRDYIRSLLDVDGLGFINSITGGSMLQMSFFALSVSPYITASIVIQLITVLSPSLEEMRKDGKTGMDKYKKITNITGVVLGFVQAAAMAVGLGRNGLLDPFNWKTVVLATIIWSIGGAVIILIGMFLDMLEIGNGISMILFCNIVASIPSDIVKIFEFASVKNRAGMIITCIMANLLALALVYVSTVCQETEKRITITQTRKGYRGPDSVFPIPFLTCSVMPVIFAGSIMSFPIMIAQFVPKLQDGIFGKCIRMLNTSMWFNADMPIYTFGAVLYIGLTVLFTYFYLDIGFNAYEIADNLKKQGAVIPGIRTGKPTAELIDKISKKVAVRGNMAMVGIILFTYMVCNMTGIGSVSIAGTSCFILVNVAIEEYKLAAANMRAKLARNRNGFVLAKLVKSI